MHLFPFLSQALGHQLGVVADTTGLRRILGRDDMAQPWSEFCVAPGEAMNWEVITTARYKYPGSGALRRAR